MRKARFIFNRHCLSPLLGKGITATYSLRHIHRGLTLLCPTYLNGVLKSTEVREPFAETAYEGPRGTASPRWTRTETDFLGRTIAETHPGFRSALLVTSNEYDTANRLVSTRAYSQPSQLSQPSQPSSPSPLTYTSFTYDSLGDRVTTVSDRNFNGVADLAGPDLVSSNETRYVKLGGDWWRESRQFSYHWDDSAEPQLMSTARTRVTGFSSETVSIDLRGNATTRLSVRDRDAATETAVTRYPTSTTPASSVSSNGLLVASTSQTGVTTTYGYDELERQISQTDGRGNTTRTVYDAQGRVSSTIDALGHATTHGYDALGRQIAVTDPLGHTITTAYDAEGRILAQRGATYPVDYTYDAYGNKVSMTTYRNENLTEGDTTHWLYDEPSGCMTNKVYADGKGPRYDYTPDGKLARRTWARGIVTDYTYDNAGRLISTTYSDDTPTVSFVYNRAGRQTEAHDAAGITTFAYDAFGANTNETVIGVAGTNVLERFYDVLGRSTGYALNGERHTILAYDSCGRISSMQVPTTEKGENVHSPTPTQNSNSFHWTYLQGSDLKSSLTYPNGLTASWQYDANNQLLQVKNATPTNVISHFDYTYDAAGRRTEIAKSGSAFEFDDVVSYGYNARSELTNAVAAVDANYRYSYQYDPIGNRESSSERGTNTTYAANELNQYTQIAATGEDAFVPEFDDDGNQTLVKTATGVWQVTYNGENRPVLWTCGATNIVMSYDRMGRRITKNAQCFVYDGYLQIANRHSPTPTQNSNYYIWDPTEPVGTRSLAWYCGDSVAYYVHDGNKNVAEVVGLSFGVTALYTYAPFGSLMLSMSSCARLNPWRFSCEYADDEIGVDYFNYRQYNPVLGRWLSFDLIESKMLYLFVNNGPVFDFDRLGLYGDDVHSKFIQFYLLLLKRKGLYSGNVDNIVLGSIAPDADFTTSPIAGVPIDALGFNLIDSQKVFHNLNGLERRRVDCFRNCVANLADGVNGDEFLKGVYLHVLGDTFAHLDSDGNAYKPYIGHGHKLTLPDDVHYRLDRFKGFVSSLNGIFKVTNGINDELDRLYKLLGQKVLYMEMVCGGGRSCHSVPRYRLRTLSEVIDILVKECKLDAGNEVSYPSQIWNEALDFVTPDSWGWPDSQESADLVEYREKLKKARNRLRKCLDCARGQP